MESYPGSVLMKYIRDDDVNFSHLFNCKCLQWNRPRYVILDGWKQIMHNVAVITKEEFTTKDKTQRVKRDGPKRMIWIDKNKVNGRLQGYKIQAQYQSEDGSQISLAYAVFTILPCYIISVNVRGLHLQVCMCCSRFHCLIWLVT